MTFNRRDILQLGLASGAAIATTPLISACVPAPLVLDVAIIGAGISGMTAGYQLHQQGVKSFAVLEARDRVGGRTYNQTVNDQPIDAGATWIGPTQTKMYALCKELGLSVFPSYWRGAMSTLVDGIVARVPGTFGAPIADPRLLAKVEALAQTVPLHAPWQTPNARQLDAQTYAQFLAAAGMPAEELAVLNLVCLTTFGARADQISLLYVLFYIHSAGSYTVLETMLRGAQQDRIKGGTQAVSLAIHQRLGDAVLLHRSVTKIHNWNGVGLTEIETARGRVRARRVIMALSPSQAAQIEYSPRLPTGRQAILDGWPRGGSGMTMHFGYQTPFWRKQGLSGLAVELIDGASMLIADMSPEDGSCGILKTLGPVSNAKVRRRNATASLIKLFGAEAASPTQVTWQDWSTETYTRGCVSPMAPGFLSNLDTELAAPCGALHWAGTETSTIWMGYMDGAARAGSRAALEVTAALTKAGAPTPQRSRSSEISDSG